jgi:hypothetical protein
MYFVLLIFEKYSGYDVKDEKGKHHFIKHVYTLFFVVNGWVLFRAENIGKAIEYYKDMYLNMNGIVSDGFLLYFRQYAWLFAVAAVVSTPLIRKAADRVSNNRAAGLAGAFILAVLFMVSVSFIVKNSYNPFIYFNF